MYLEFAPSGGLVGGRLCHAPVGIPFVAVAPKQTS